MSAELQRALATYGATSHLVADQDERTPERTSTDWTAFPARIGACLTRDQARSLLDWRTDLGDEGRRRFQEEYAEWRVARSADGKIRRFELTTELPDYWLLLAGTEPVRALELLADFAGEDNVASNQVYGTLDPFGEEVTDAQREDAFAQNMLGEGRSPYNDGTRAICCMRQPTNTLSALVSMVVAATRPHVVRDRLSGLIRCANAAELIPLLNGAAEAGRNSDPVLVERLARLAFERRLVTFDSSPGVFIQGVQLERLLAPDGSPALLDWFTFTRGGPSTVPDGRSRFQRLAFEIPGDQGLCIGDLVDGATGRPVPFGAELADLVRLAVYLRTSVQGVVGEAVEPRATPDPVVEPSGCDEVRAGWHEFEKHSGAPPASG